MTHDMHTRALGRASTLDREARTVGAVALSGPAPAVRPAPAPDGTRSRWIEELDAGGADLSRFVEGPALLGHRNAWDASVGSVASARVEGDRIICTVRFDGSDEATRLIDKIEAGSVRGVSLGYSVETWTRAGARDGVPVYRATKWTPRELSFAPLGVDPGATVRSQEITMDDQTIAPADNPAPETTADPGTAMNRADVNREIRSIGRLAGMDQGSIDALIDNNATADDARRAAFEAMAKRSAPVDNRPARVEGGADYTDPDLIRRSMADALAANMTPLCKAEGQATQYRSYRPLDMVAELLSARGERVNRFDREALLTRALGAHSSSDFPSLLADAANKSLLAQYTAAAPAYRSIAARRSFSDFKAHKFLRVGDFPTFHEVEEGGETRYGTISENKETVTATEYATGIVIGRRALLNDDLSALSDFSGLIATRTAAFEDATVFALLATDGPTLSDGVTMFSTAATRSNKASSAAAIGVDAVGLGVKALRGMTGLDGLPINVQPRYLVCGIGSEVKARQLLATITPAQASNVNPWSGAFELVVSPHVSSNRWHIAADPAQVPCVVYGYVNGADGPQISTEVDFDTRAVKVRAGLDFGCGVIDWRGWYLNTGA
ncbi:prohead protease/major capsid protein fusion protein [uncultured Rhodospira sp.]|uniref:prohead protease/major capsid protein fusion protein n=1 Tax=uncultured Rhodospira sp. TaxID=1936189 RepID=UPI00263601F0|nr:prohead protease/major capsid protein fusion protein [uncultured Rhodospira sp.]